MSTRRLFLKGVAALGLLPSIASGTTPAPQRRKLSPAQEAALQQAEQFLDRLEQSVMRYPRPDRRHALASIELARLRITAEREGTHQG